MCHLGGVELADAGRPTATRGGVLLRRSRLRPALGPDFAVEDAADLVLARLESRPRTGDGDRVDDGHSDSDRGGYFWDVGRGRGRCAALNHRLVSGHAARDNHHRHGGSRHVRPCEPKLSHTPYGAGTVLAMQAPLAITTVGCGCRSNSERPPAQPEAGTGPAQVAGVKPSGSARRVSLSGLQ